jgi:hypothetical protein
VSFGDLFPEEREAATVAQALRPVRPREDTGFDLGREAAFVRDQVGSVLAYGARGATLAASAPLVAFDRLAGTKTADVPFEFTRRYLDTARDFWKPDPQGVSMAGQIVGGLARFGTEFAMGGPMGVVVNEQMRISQEVADAGGDAQAIATAGAVRGLTTGIGLKLAAAYGSSVPTRVASGAALNASLGIADRALIGAVLEGDDLDAMAQQYQAFDPVQLTVDAIFGGVIGGLSRGAAPDAPVRSEADVELRAAAQTLNLQNQKSSGFLLPEGAEADAGLAMIDEAVRSVRAGRPVAVPETVPLDAALLGEATARIEAGMAEFDAAARAERALDEARSVPEAEPPPAPDATAEGGQAAPDTAAADPVSARMQPMASARPDLTIEIDLGAGEPVRMTLADAVAYMQREAETAESDSRGFEAAANCFLRG